MSTRALSDDQFDEPGLPMDGRRKPRKSTREVGLWDRPEHEPAIKAAMANRDTWVKLGGTGWQAGDAFRIATTSYGSARNNIYQRAGHWDAKSRNTSSPDGPDIYIKFQATHEEMDAQHAARRAETRKREARNAAMRRGLR